VAEEDSDTSTGASKDSIGYGAKKGSEVFFTGIMHDQSAEQREHEKSEALLRNCSLQTF
jgi:hypothetical protein